MPGHRWTVAALALFLAGQASAGPTPAQKCVRAKHKEAAQYASCRQNADARFALNGAAAARTTAYQKCLATYDRKWPRLEAKAVAAGGTCPSAGDQTTIRTFIDLHTSDVAAALAGGPLPDCPGSLTECVAALTACEAIPPGQPLETGQTACWDAGGIVGLCAGTGQDGESQRGLTRTYVDNGDGTIADMRTGLMWEKLSDDGSIHDKDTSYTWADAFAVKVATLNAEAFAGHGDWRVPNMTELQSLVNYGAVNPAISPAFNTACQAACTVLTCSCTLSGFYWSATTSQVAPSGAWIVHFNAGNVGANVKTGIFRVRAVRGGS